MFYNIIEELLWNEILEDKWTRISPAKVCQCYGNSSENAKQLYYAELYGTVRDEILLNSYQRMI